MNRREAIAALMALPAATTVSVASVGRDDVVVIEIPTGLSAEQAEHITKLMEGIWPGRQCVVLANGMKLKILRSNHD